MSAHAGAIAQPPWRCLSALIVCLSLLFPAAARADDTQSGDRLLAVYLPGVLFARLEDKVELGNELAAYLGAQLGERYRLTPRVYATVEALDADSARSVLLLAESPLVAARLSTLVPAAVAAVGGSSDTRLHVLGSSAIKALSDLRGSKLHYALPLDNPSLFVENLLFEGELALPRDRLLPTRDVSSLLSLASLRKADALLLYEDDLAPGQKAGLRSLYSSAPLPRPTLAASVKRVHSAVLCRLREVMTGFHSASLPAWRSFRPTQEAPYQALRQRQERRPKRLPPLLELDEEASQLPLPQPPQTPPRVPLTTYAPRL
jgi:hypothetical protein